MVKMRMGGEEVQPREVVLAELLIEHAGRIVKRIKNKQNIVHANEESAVQQIGCFHKHSSSFLFVVISIV